jgi:hypothetical protein
VRSRELTGRARSRDVPFSLSRSSTA